MNENASYPASGVEILSAPHYTKEIHQKASEIWLFGNDFLSVVSFRTMWTGGYRWRKYVINQPQLLSSSCWSRFSRSELSIGSVFAKEELKRFSCFEFWISNGWFHIPSLSARAVQIKYRRTRPPFPSTVCYGPHPTSHVVLVSSLVVLEMRCFL